MSTQKEPEKGVFHDCSIAFIASSALFESLITQASSPPLSSTRNAIPNIHHVAERYSRAI